MARCWRAADMARVTLTGVHCSLSTLQPGVPPARVVGCTCPDCRQYDLLCQKHTTALADLVLAVHILAAIVGFGVVFAFPVILAGAGVLRARTSNDLVRLCLESELSTCPTAVALGRRTGPGRTAPAPPGSPAA